MASAQRPASAGPSCAFGQRLRNAGLLGSMGSVGDRYDNATMESFWGTLQLEVLDHSSIGMYSRVGLEQLHTPSDHDR